MTWVFCCRRVRVRLQGEFQLFISLDKAPAKSVIQLCMKKFGTVGDLNKASDDRETHSG